MQTGAVIACLSQIGTPVAGGDALFIGNMRYELVASPSFIKQHLKGVITEHAVLQAPSLIYDQHDQLWAAFQESCQTTNSNVQNHHWYPSSQGFVDLVLGGTVCAIIPTVQIRNELESGELISLLPNKPIDLPLYWHWYKLNAPILNRLTKTIQIVTQNLLY